MNRVGPFWVLSVGLALAFGLSAAVGDDGKTAEGAKKKEDPKNGFRETAFEQGRDAAAAGEQPIAKSESAISTSAGGDESLLTNLNDPAFQRYIDLNLLVQAWTDMDPALLTDLALQLAEGERVLLRPHKAMSADKMFELAIHVARAKRDKVTLDRLTKAVQSRDEALGTRIAAAKTLAESSRGLDAPLTLPVDTSPEVFAAFKMVIEQVDRACVRGDAAMLDNLSASLEQIDIFEQQHADALNKLIANSREQIDPEVESPMTGPLAGILDLLADSSRYPAEEYEEEEGPSEQPAQVAGAFFQPLTFESRGWFSDATGYRTPQPIQSIAPRGISIGNRNVSDDSAATWQSEHLHSSGHNRPGPRQQTTRQPNNSGGHRQPQYQPQPQRTQLNQLRMINGRVYVYRNGQLVPFGN